MTRPGIHFEDLEAIASRPDTVHADFPPNTLAAPDLDMHRRRRGSEIAGCGIPAKQDQLTDDGELVTCRRPGCRA